MEGGTDLVRRSHDATLLGERESSPAQIKICGLHWRSRLLWMTTGLCPGAQPAVDPFCIGLELSRFDRVPEPE